MTDLLHTLDTTWLGPWAALALGLILGSFYNVCIHRLPLDQSVVREPSHCPHCRARIPWRLNVPVVSWLWLRGRCAACGARISVQYPLVELSTGFLFLWLAWRYGWGWHFLCYAVFLSSLLVVSVIDLHHRIIPDEISLPGIALGVGASFLTKDITWYESVVGALSGGGIFFAVAFLYEKVAGREGLGGGDVKLLALIGAWLGPRSVLIVIILSTGLGSVVGLAVMWAQKKDMKTAIPFGPFLSGAAAAYLVWREELLALFFPHF